MKEKMKSNKRIRAMVMVTILVLSLGTFVIPLSLASAGTTVGIDNASANYDATTTTAITAYDVENLGNFGITVTFDPDVVNVTGVTGNPDVGTFFWDRITDERVDLYTINFVDIPSLSGDVLLATLTLHAVGSQGETSPLGIEIGQLFDNESDPIPATPVNGTFTVTGVAPPTIVSYTISNDTITPPQTTEIDVEFSETVDYIIAIEKDAATIYDWTGTARHPNAKEWDGTYEVNDTVVPDGDYTVNVTGTNTTTGMSVTDTSKTITVQTVVGPATTVTKTPAANAAGWNNGDVTLTFLRSCTDGIDIDYTNLSATPDVNATISNNSWTWNVTLTGENISVPVNTTLGDTFNVTISDECDVTISYYSVDKNTTPRIEATKTVTVKIDMTPPGTVTGLNAIDRGCTWINWTWTNPPDADFSYVMVYSDLCVHEANVSGAPGGTSYINTSDFCTFEPNTTHEIRTRTVDIAGNVNLTWVNDTATTLADTEDPVYSDVDVDNTIAGLSTVFSAYWTDDVELSGYRFAIDNGTGTLVNDSFVSMTGTEDWSNVTKTLNSTVGVTIRWRVYANDTSDNWNDTGIQTFTTTAVPVYGVNLTVDEEAKPTVEGVNATYVLTVNNTGNAVDTFNLTYTNIDNATAAELNRTQVTLNALETGIVLLDVTNETVGVGTFRVNVTATSRGNASVFDCVNTTTTVTQDTTPPTITINAPTAGWYNANITVNATVTDVSGVNASTVMFRWENATASGIWTLMTNVAGDYYEKTFDITAVADGNYTINVTATDNATTPNEGTETVTGIGIDRALPYTSGHSPANGATGIAIDKNIVVHVKDDDSGVDQATLVMTVEGVDVTSSVSITDTAGDYTLTYNPSTDFGYEQVVNVTIAASDLAGNTMTPDGYSFTTKSAPAGPRGGGGTPRDTDGDGYTDIQEMLADTDKDDPCDPNPECAACLALKPAATPTPTPTPTVTVTPTPTIPPVVTTPTPTPTPTPTEDPGFEAVFAIAGLLAVAYLVVRRKRK